VRTLTEIQDAVAKLPADERKILLTWLASGEKPQFSAEEERQLLRSLDEAAHDIDSGKGIPIDDVRKRLNSWGTK